MPRTALRCIADISIHAVSCPGVWLPRRDDVFLSVQMLGQLRQTRLESPIFPLLFHERFTFDKVFYTAFEPSQVAESLESCRILIELIQVSDLYEGGRLLASYESNVRDFLYPYPSYTSTYGTKDREVLMNRTLDFPGISPKLEFSTRTVLNATSVPTLDYDDELLYSGRKSRSRSRSRIGKTTYKQPTISSRSRSVSPSLRCRLDALDLNDTTGDVKPPFVVRKVNKDLIGRTPSGTGVDLEQGHFTEAKRKHMATGSGSWLQTNKRRKHRKGKGKQKALPRYSYDDTYYDYYYRPRSKISQVIREPGTSPLPLYSPRYYYSDVDSDDLEVARLTSSDYGYYTRPRTTSPFRSSLIDRYDERPWSLAKSDLITSRVERALRRNRSLERLDRRSTSPYSSLTKMDYDDSLRQLARDFDLARERRRYYP